MVGGDAYRGLPFAPAGVEGLLSRRLAARYGLSVPRLLPARTHLPSFFGPRRSRHFPRGAPAGLWHLLSLLQDELPLLVRSSPLGRDVLRSVFRPRSFLSWLLAWRSPAKLRFGRHLRDGCALLHDSFR